MHNYTVVCAIDFALRHHFQVWTLNACVCVFVYKPVLCESLRLDDCVRALSLFIRIIAVFQLKNNQIVQFGESSNINR